MSPSTITSNVHVAEFPRLSYTVQVTVFVPTGNPEPDGGLYVMFVIVPMQLFVTIGAGKNTLVTAPAVENGGKHVCTTILDGQVTLRHWQGSPFGSEKLIIWLHDCTTPHAKTVQVPVIVGQLVTTVRFVVAPLAQHTFVRIGGPKVQFVELHNTFWVGGQSNWKGGANWKKTEHEPNFAVTFSTNVIVMTVEVQTRVPGGGLCEHV